MTGSDLDRLKAELRQARTEAEDFQRALAVRVAALERKTAGQAQALDGASENLATLSDLAAIDAVTRWVRTVTLTEHPLVSVVLPTCGRPSHLERAIGSVLGQRYENWELLVIADGRGEESRGVVEAAQDPRIRFSQIPRAGAGAARNSALKAAEGKLIAYLDDDNMMDAEWLRAVVWAFGQRPDVEVLYGAFVVDDISRASGKEPGALPQTFFHRWRSDILRSHNVADMSAIAHRAGLPGAWFDEGLEQMGDWDLLVRLTAHRDPLRLPVVACYYTTDAPGRLSSGPTHAADRATVLARAAAVPDR